MFSPRIGLCLKFGWVISKFIVQVIKPHITSPEVVLAVARQIYEECLHVDSYSCMVEAVGLDPEE